MNPRDRKPLSPREEQCADLIERGLSDKELGAALGIAYRTVRIHVQHCFQKYRVTNRTSFAVIRVLERHGIVTFDSLPTASAKRNLQV